MAKEKTEKNWEKHEINDLTLQMILLATIGTLIATLITFFLKRVGLPEVRPELLFIPWSIALVFAVPVGFRRGVMAERRRAEGETQSK